MERLLERISISRYQQNFILKGGFLIAAMVGLDTRATMDKVLSQTQINQGSTRNCRPLWKRKRGEKPV